MNRLPGWFVKGDELCLDRTTSLVTRLVGSQSCTPKKMEKKKRMVGYGLMVYFCRSNRCGSVERCKDEGGKSAEVPRGMLF